MPFPEIEMQAAITVTARDWLLEHGKNVCGQFSLHPLLCKMPDPGGLALK
jgi:hypothetical protein